MGCVRPETGADEMRVPAKKPVCKGVWQILQGLVRCGEEFGLSPSAGQGFKQGPDVI